MSIWEWTILANLYTAFGCYDDVCTTLLLGSGPHTVVGVCVVCSFIFFRELDVVATVHNLASSCPGFWRSDECMRSCQDGAWLGLDRDAVAKVGMGRKGCLPGPWRAEARCAVRCFVVEVEHSNSRSPTRLCTAAV